MSSPGLQFLFWVLFQKGEEKGFQFLKELKASIQTIAPSWSSSYSLFKIKKPSLVFSYFTSPYYHRIEEKTDIYQASVFKHPHPVQVEYLGIPKNCERCQEAKLFARFILEGHIQKLIMKKNYMYPVVSNALDGEIFQLPEGVEYFDPLESLSSIKRKRELVNRWKAVFY